MKLCDHIWLLESSRAQGNVPGFHCYLVKDSEGLTMIDTSLPGRNKAIREEIESLGFEIGDLKRIFLTHTDIDHIGNALPLQLDSGCKVYLSEEEKKYLAGEYKRLPKKEEMFQKSHFQFPEVEAYPEDLNEYQIISSPGHTRGHVCILYEDCLFAGDACSTENGKIALPEKTFCENIELAAQSLRKVSLRNFGLWCPCHGEPKGHKMEWRG